MINTGLLTRPFSGHYPKIRGYWPIIASEIKKVSSSRKTGWRCRILIDDAPVFMGHYSTKRLAEIQAGKMVEAYTEVHYKKEE